MVDKNNVDRPDDQNLPIGDHGFSLRLRQALNGRSGAWLAKRIDASAASVNAWLRGENDPSLSRVIASAQVLGVSVQWLATGGERDSSVHERTTASGDASSLGPDPIVDKLLLAFIVKSLNGLAELLQRQASAALTPSDLKAVIALSRQVEAMKEGRGMDHQDLWAALERIEGDLRLQDATSDFAGKAPQKL